MTSYEGAFITKIFKLYVLCNLKRSYYTLLNACYQSEVRFLRVLFDSFLDGQAVS